jgi:uncharacterized protein (DUF342 family)
MNINEDKIKSLQKRISIREKNLSKLRKELSELQKSHSEECINSITYSYDMDCDDGYGKTPALSVHIHQRWLW